MTATREEGQQTWPLQGDGRNSPENTHRRRNDKFSSSGQISSQYHRSPSKSAPTGGEKRGGGDIGGDRVVGCPSGLSILERDVRGAMVAVWLAWGVRIDAAREELRREERWLDAVHRTEIAKVANVGISG